MNNKFETFLEWRKKLFTIRVTHQNAFKEISSVSY